MDRKDFLNSIGMSAAAFAIINCVGCKKTDGTSTTDTTGPTGVNFTLDLSLAANAVLLSNGGSLVSNGVIVAKTKTGAYIAVQRSCTHLKLYAYLPIGKQPLLLPQPWRNLF